MARAKPETERGTRQTETALNNAKGEHTMTASTTPRFDLVGKTVLVTGATRGIGRASALACAGAGTR